MDNLSELLLRTEESDYESGLEFELDILPLFCDVLGIDEDYMYYSPALGEGLRPDGLVQINVNKDPWLVVEAKYTDSPNVKENAIAQVTRYLHVTGADVGVVIGVGYILVVDPDDGVTIQAESADDEDLETIETTLAPPDRFRVSTDNEYPERASTSEQVSESNYEIDLGELEEALDAVDQAESNNEKGDTFENLADLLFGAIPFLEVRDRNLVTNTGEVDLVVEYTGSESLTIFDDWSRFILVECKNWSSSVGVPQVRNFKGKMDKAQVDIGILFARNGISGDYGAEALRWIHDYFQRESRMILVIGDSELSQLLDGENFYELLDESMYQRRFDFD